MENKILDNEEYNIIASNLKKYVNMYYSQRNNITKIGQLKSVRHNANGSEIFFYFKILKNEGDIESSGNRYSQSKRIIRKISPLYLKKFQKSHPGKGWPLLISIHDYYMYKNVRNATNMTITIHQAFIEHLVKKWITLEKLNILLK